MIDGAPPITGFTGTSVDGSAHVPFPASVTNISGVNTVSTFSNVQGIFLLEKLPRLIRMRASDLLILGLACLRATIF